MHSYISLVIQNKQSMSKAFNPNNVTFKLKIRSLRLPNLQRQNVWDVLIKTGLELTKKEEELTLASFGNGMNKRIGWEKGSVFCVFK
jgi:hypothetical protein